MVHKLILLPKTSDAIKNKFSDIFVDTGKTKIENFNGTGTLFRAITGNLDAINVEYVTDYINKLNQVQALIENFLKNQFIITPTVIKNFIQKTQQLQIGEKTFKDALKNRSYYPSTHRKNSKIGM